MATRIFEFDNYDGEPARMMFLEDNEISNTYNPYGAYHKIEDYEELMECYTKERNEAFSDFVSENESYTLADVKAFLIEFIEDYEYWSDGHSRGTGRPKMLIQCRDEEWVSNDEGYYDEDGNATELEAIEVYSYWDGHNWKELILNSEYNSSVTEITGQYCAVEEMVTFGSWRGDTSGGHFLWDAENEKVLEYEWSAYQGVEPIWREISLLDLVRKIDEQPDVEALVVLINEELAVYDLKKGEKLYLEDGDVTFEYRGEQYHYSNDEITDEYAGLNGDACYGTTINLSKAREAIKKRRVEAVTSKFARNNYEKVLELPLKTIWVTYENSISAGNCEARSTDLMNKIMEDEAIGYREFAFRADVLLGYRDDNYSRRAILNAYKSRLRQA